MMSPIEAVKTCFRKYVTFSGRARRSEFWWFILITILIGIPFSLTPATDLLWTLGTLLPTLAVGCRRLHDIDRTGWWQAFPLIPMVMATGLIYYGVVSLVIFIALLVIPFLVLVVFWVLPGTKGENRYGNDPINPVNMDAAVFD